MKNQKIVLYNGMPIKLNKAYAIKELKQTNDFINKLIVKINSDELQSENAAYANDLLSRRKEWAKALTEYLAELK